MIGALPWILAATVSSPSPTPTPIAETTAEPSEARRLVPESRGTDPAEPRAGTLCVAPVLAPAPGKKTLGNPSGENPEAKYTVQVDKRVPIPVPTTGPPLRVNARAGQGYTVDVHTTIEAEVDAQGNIRLTEAVSLAPGSRVLITILQPEGLDTAAVSESSLSVDWSRPEEDPA